MTVVQRKYRPPHTSEREIPVWNCCRLVVLTAARGVETTGEVFVKANGSPYTHDNRESIVKVLRRFASEKRGEPPSVAKGYNRQEALYAYERAWPGSSVKAIDPTMEELRDLLRSGWFISVSGSVDDVPGRSPLDDWVSDYPHEIGLCPYPTDTGPLVVEPMRPKGAGLIRVPWSDIAKFSSEFAVNGRRHCIAVKAGYATKAAEVRRAKPDQQTIERLRDARDRLQDTVGRLMTDIAAAEARNNDLLAQLTECREDKCAAEIEGVLDRLHEWEEAERTAL